jgi:hypothetical protein
MLQYDDLPNLSQVSIMSRDSVPLNNLACCENVKMMW